MIEVREQVVLPPNVDVSEPASVDFMVQLASRLAPGLERSVGPVYWRVGDATGVDWTAEGFVEGAFVVVCLRPSSREVSLLVDPRFARARRQTPILGRLLLFGAIAASIVIGAITRSFGWGFASLFAAAIASVCVDAVRQEQTVRHAILTLDRTGWRRRFQDAIASALSSG